MKLSFSLFCWFQETTVVFLVHKSGAGDNVHHHMYIVFLSRYCTKMYPIALMLLCPLSSVCPEAWIPHVLVSSCGPPVPNPILESTSRQLFWLLAKIPILALEALLFQNALSGSRLNPSLLQYRCREPCAPISDFHVSRPNEVGRYCPSAISEYRESAFVLMRMNLSSWLIFIPRQILEKEVFQ